MSLVAAACGDDDDADAPTTTAGVESTTTTEGAATSTTAGASATTTTQAPTTTVAEEEGGILVIGAGAAAEIVLPAATTASATTTIVDQVFDGLIRMDLDGSGQMEGALAESWTLSDDGLVYTFTLRSGVLFHDGSAFNADVVTLNYERLTDPESPLYWDVGASIAEGQLYSNVASVDKVDDMTVTYTVIERDPDFFFKLARSHGDFISADVLNSVAPEDVPQNAVGAGPFKLASIEPGALVRLERFDDYWDGAPLLEEVIYQALGEDAARVAALQAGDVDLITVAPFDDLARLTDDFDAFQWGVKHAYLTAFNTRHPVTSDVRVRQAINYAVDVESIVNDLFGGAVDLAQGPYSPSNAAFNPDLVGYGYDPDRARELLAEAGHADGVSFGAIIPSNIGAIPLIPEVMQTIQSDLAEVGIDVTFETVEWNAYLDIVRQGLSDDHAWYLTAWGAAEPSWLELLHGEAKIAPDGANRGYYVNPEVEALFDQARSATDPATRISLYQQAEELIVADAPWLYTFYTPTVGLQSPNVSGIGESYQSYNLSRATVGG